MNGETTTTCANCHTDLVTLGQNTGLQHQYAWIIAGIATGAQRYPFAAYRVVVCLGYALILQYSISGGGSGLGLGLVGGRGCTDMGSRRPNGYPLGLGRGLGFGFGLSGGFEPPSTSLSLSCRPGPAAKSESSAGYFPPLGSGGVLGPQDVIDGPWPLVCQ